MTETELILVVVVVGLSLPPEVEPPCDGEVLALLLWTGALSHFPYPTKQPVSQ